jgi:hypothetical protein
MYILPFLSKANQVKSRALTSHYQVLLSEEYFYAPFHILMKVLVNHHLVNIDDVDILVFAYYQDVSRVVLKIFDLYCFRYQHFSLGSQHASAIVRVPEPDSVV